jgi:rhamnosyltransferase
MGQSMSEPALPRICVLMATFNGRPWIEEQVSSILGQRGVDVRLFVSDDLSTDGTREWLEELAHQHERVLLLSGERRFGSAAANFYHLIENAPIGEEDLVAFADQDDVWHPDKLWRHCQLLRDRSVDAVSSDVTAFWPSGREALIRKSYPQRRWDFLFEPPGPGCTFLMRGYLVLCCRQVIREASRARLQPLPFHDWMVYLVARAAGFRWWIDPVPSLRYRQHGRNEVGAHVGWRAILSRLRKLARGEYGRMVGHALTLSRIVVSGNPNTSRLRLRDVLFKGRRRLRDRVVAALFMPMGVRPSRHLDTRQF